MTILAQADTSQRTFDPYNVERADCNCYGEIVFA